MKKAVREPTKALASAPPATRERVGHPVRADTPAIADESKLLSDLRGLIQSARQRIASATNATRALLCGHLGRRLLNENLQGNRPAYGKQILVTASRELSVENRRGFSYAEIVRMVCFAKWIAAERILATGSQESSWSHFMESLPTKKSLAREAHGPVVAMRGGRSSPGVLPNLLSGFVRQSDEGHTGDRIKA